MSTSKLVATVVVSACAAFAQGPKKIVFVGANDAKLIGEVRTVVPGANLVAASGPELAEQIVDADAVIGSVKPEQFRLAKKLKWIHITSAGVEKGLFPELVNSQVVVTNAKNVYGPQIADHAFAFLLALTRRLNVTIPEQVNEGWGGGREGMFELDGRQPLSSALVASV